MNIRISQRSNDYLPAKVSPTALRNKNAFANFNTPTKVKNHTTLTPIQTKQNKNTVLLLTRKLNTHPFTIERLSNKGVSLYQEIERNKHFGQGIELMNRVSFKV
ncbi:MAG: hypothetical protein QM484_14240 [Woeseiaceae bacterium]